jgi:hypothetical protein
MFPLAPAERTLDVLWAVGSDADRDALAAAVGDLLDRSRELAALQSMPRDADQAETFLDLLGLDLGLEARPLPPAARALWERWRERVVPASLRFLELSIREERDDAVVLRAVGLFLAGRGQIRTWLEVVNMLEFHDRAGPAAALFERVLAHFGENVEALAEGFETWSAEGGADGPRRRLAAALVAAHALHPGPRSPEATMALRVARRWLPRAQAKRKPAARKPGRAKAAPPQRRLPGVE